MYYSLPIRNQKVCFTDGEVYKYNAFFGKWFSYKNSLLRKIMRVLVNKKERTPAYTVHQGSIVRTLDGICWVIVDKHFKKLYHEADLSEPVFMKHQSWLVKKLRSNKYLNED